MSKWEKRKFYNHTISVKLVIPSGCNAKCEFCYMKNLKRGYMADKEQFLKNYIQSLKFLVNKIDNRNPISLDITGNEPILDVNFLKQVIEGLRKSGIKKEFSRVTMTTNGTNLYQSADFLCGFVDYVNISVHHFIESERKRIMGISFSDSYYKQTIRKLNNNGIKTSAICVIYEKICNFNEWVENFVNWANDLGFIGLRIRCDVFWKESDMFNEYMNEKIADKNYDLITHEKTPDSHWCRLRRMDKFRLFFLKGVENTGKFTKGIEYVVADDGKLYADYNKEIPIERYGFTIGEIYDNSELIKGE